MTALRCSPAALELARRLLAVFVQHGYPFLGAALRYDGELYPLIVVWDDSSEVTLVIACTENRYSGEAAQRYARHLAKILRDCGKAPTGAVGMVAHPAATDPNAIMIEEMIWPSPRGHLKSEGT